MAWNAYSIDDINHNYSGMLHMIAMGLLNEEPASEPEGLRYLRRALQDGPRWITRALEHVGCCPNGTGPQVFEEADGETVGLRVPLEDLGLGRITDYAARRDFAQTLAQLLRARDDPYDSFHLSIKDSLLELRLRRFPPVRGGQGEFSEYLQRTRLTEFFRAGLPDAVRFRAANLPPNPPMPSELATSCDAALKAALGKHYDECVDALRGATHTLVHQYSDHRLRINLPSQITGGYSRAGNSVDDIDHRIATQIGQACGDWLCIRLLPELPTSDPETTYTLWAIDIDLPANPSEAGERLRKVAAQIAENYQLLKNGT